MLKINTTKYKKVDPKQWLVFLNRGHENIHPEFAGRLAYLCSVKKKKLYISRGLVTTEEQIIIADVKLKANPTWYRGADGRIYKPGNPPQSMVAAPGNSPHEFAHAVDSGDSWFKALSNQELAEYGLVKPVAHEPWHAQLIETKGVARSELKEDYENRTKLDIMELQMFLKKLGLYTGDIDGKAGPLTRAAIRKCIQLLCQIIGTDYKTAEEAINATQNSPDIWIGRLKTISYFDVFVMNIVNKMKGLG